MNENSADGSTLHVAQAVPGVAVTPSTNHKCLQCQQLALASVDPTQWNT